MRSWDHLGSLPFILTLSVWFPVSFPHSDRLSGASGRYCPHVPSFPQHPGPQHPLRGTVPSLPFAPFHLAGHLQASVPHTHGWLTRGPAAPRHRTTGEAAARVLAWSPMIDTIMVRTPGPAAPHLLATL